MEKLKLILIAISVFASLIFAKTTHAATCLENCRAQGNGVGECNVLCSGNEGSFDSKVFGTIPLPSPLANFGDVDAGGIGKFLNVIFRVIVVGSGIYALINLLVGGYEFMAASNDPKKVGAAWSRIWQTFMGLAFTAGAFVLAAIFGQIIFGDPTFILNPDIPTL